ncbi:TIGR03086 family protein [Aeromicrobium sp. 636]|uniref:Maleylpyruvate isomerase N-terminal domain-containing protein n=1 Tax=Aeromicrobium senzhongii TaxID=2663859 RepID=A0A8I0EXY0_9ACTN|nr:MULTISPECIES: maleylpyruvate isomerase N-terminal domain-containing protein [Aeromicrobium]MBC9227689.1 maleylpyruvate isomerase N-terminal domain-containing protein [Aeromicrobium senzhongii]MCQ3999786.1 TIGR03086 family protein [Aeromicrobium sp. 636]
MPAPQDVSPGRAPADRHRRIAEGFGAVVEHIRDWDAPTPVPQWQARDVVLHLVTWSQGFLGAGGIDLARQVDSGDPAGTWHAHAAEIQALLESSAAAQDFTHPQLGTDPLDAVVDRFYTTDVLMHSWDLAESAGVPSGLDPVECAQILEGMRPHEQLLRDSGQYGPAVPVPPERDAVVRLMGFIGRDPEWSQSR